MAKYNLVKGLIWRFVRASGAVILAGLASSYADNQIYLAIAPILITLDKYLRSLK